MEEEEQLLKLLGERIKQLRINAGYKSQEAFAYDANIPRAQYGRYETGSNITIISLDKIIKYHQLTLSQFFSEGFDTDNKKADIPQKKST